MVYDKYTEKAIDKAVQNLKKKKDELGVRQTRPALIKITNAWLANQKRHNYNNEYERLIGILTNKAITHSGNTEQLESRVKHLETLGARAVTGLNGNKKKETYDQIMSKVKNT